MEVAHLFFQQTYIPFLTCSRDSVTLCCCCLKSAMKPYEMIMLTRRKIHSILKSLSDLSLTYMRRNKLYKFNTATQR